MRCRVGKGTAMTVRNPSLSTLSATLLAFALAVATSPCNAAGIPIVLPTPAPAAAIVARPAVENTRAIATASNAFAMDLWGRAGKSSGNLAISPASISAALTMTWGGAKGATAIQMRHVLHLQMDATTAGAQWGDLVRALEDPARPFTLRIANRLFGEKTFAFEQPFLAWTKQDFGAALQPMDFKHAADASRAQINTWIDQRTEHRIANLLSPGSIDARTRLLLVNAIYFHAGWGEKFQESATSPQPFFVSPSDQRDVATMRQRHSFQAAEIDGVKILEMGYEGGDATMLLVLPDKVDGLAEVEKNLTVATFESWTRALAWKQEVIVSLPRFELDPATALSLREDLTALGMPAAFDLQKADFTGIANSPDPRERLNISDVVHKSFVKVDEKGTEAAAATAVIMRTMAVAPRRQPLPPFVFRADHPFLFFIIDKPTGLILFMGRVSDPASK
jgi:serpin B